ncbi:nucleotidyltransferase [Anaerocolumna aminovalerica]|uniref:tRNA(Met) cytidine acetate ligase n=1 Tax=Anaerocolumna aminovalerica TaxID=1527 RepID=A0A1I5HAC8_9FIRM|nr:nucleotidyltransferase [Anaerocolumna aminovalerica]SFO44781.1 Predicted nucleotidyltransferase [Anaerocolumna aminovalerica]
MKVVGLITEYNPFHNGHKYHMEEAKRITGADHVVVVMSGNFVQRGTPAIMNKYSRAKMALSCGADVVFELPVCYSTGSAEYFSLGAVSLLNQLGIIDEICFGSECGNVHELTSIARIVAEEPLEYKTLLGTFLKKGYTFPLARTYALKALLPDIDEAILSSPNNILGIEYIKALMQLKSSIKPVTIVRKLAGYHEEELNISPQKGTSTAASKTASISSATAIRKSILETTPLTALEPHVPGEVLNILKEEYSKTFPIYDDDYTLLLQYKLMLETKESLSGYLDLSNDIANRIKNTNISLLTYSQLAQEIKTKQLTLTRVNRAFTHILLNITTASMEEYKRKGYTQYARILGLKKASSYLLRQIQDKAQIPIITKVGNASKTLNQTGRKMLHEDIFAANLYNQVIYHKYNTLIKDEYTHGIILI